MSILETRFVHPYGALELRRWPRLPGELLRAWDGADRYLLEALSEEGGSTGEPLLVLNDQWGALSLALLKQRVLQASGDSFVSYAALVANAEDNGLSSGSLDWAWADQPLPSGAGAVLMRVPKELSLLEWQLASLVGRVQPGAPVWLAGMDKHLPRQLLQVMGRYLETPTAGLGRHKARLFRARVPVHALNAAPMAACVTVPESGWQLRNAAGVFSREQLDIGARFFMAHVPAGVSGDICDLGCGNGIIGMVALQRNPDATLWCCDESALALASARLNIEAQFAGRQVHYHHGNGLDGLTGQFDLILLNPPFHIGHTVDDRVARMLFRHARRHLKPQGRLRVIGNRHLGYAALLRKHFSRVTEVAQNSKFTIVDATLL